MAPPPNSSESAAMRPIVEAIPRKKVAFGAELADRPLLLLGVILILVGVQLVSLGLVAEVLGRTYHEAQGKRPYHVREWVVGGQLARVPISDRIHANDA